MNKWIKLIRQNCSQDWVEWKTECVLKIVDRQVDVMQKEMEAENKIKYVDPIVIEHPADDSKAQQLLGGTLEIKAPWFDPKVTKE